ARLVRLVQRERGPCFGVVRIIKSRWHDADDRGGFSVEHYLAVHNTRRAAEASLPKRVADHDHGLGALLHVAVLQCAALNRIRFEEWKKLAGHARTAHALSLVAGSQKQTARKESHDLFERRGLLLPVNDVRHRQVAQRDSLPRINPIEQNDSIRLRKLQRS